jgi:hypothetical protein
LHLLPTLNRIAKLKTFLASAIAAETTTPGLVIIDKSDYAANLTGYSELTMPDGWELYISDSVGMGDKVREVWPKVRDGAWVSLLNDDHEIITPHWDTILIKQLNGKNFISCSDQWNAPARAAGATIWSMPLLEELGWPIFPPQINHLGVDDCFETLGRATGVWRVDMHVIVRHNHVYKGGVMDDTHKLTYGEGNWANSPAHIDVQQRFKAFMELEFPQAVEKIKKFSGVENYFVKSAKPKTPEEAAPQASGQV